MIFWDFTKYDLGILAFYLIFFMQGEGIDSWMGVTVSQASLYAAKVNEWTTLRLSPQDDCHRSCGIQNLGRLLVSQHFRPRGNGRD